MTAADPRRWPISLRLTLFFAAVLCVTLCGVAWLLYRDLDHQLWEKDEADIRRTMNVHLGIVKALDSHERRDTGPDLWQREWAEHVQLGRGAWLKLFAPDGSVHGQPDELPVPEREFPKPKSKGALKRFETKVDGKEMDLVLSATEIESRSGRRWVMQGVFDVSKSHEVLEKFRERMLMLIAAAILLSSLAGWWLVRRSLSPLRDMSHRIAGIDAERLDLRLADRAWPSDIQKLATSFDEMMRRLEAAFVQLSRFSSDLAHEFRSPITNLVSAAGVMLSRERTVPEYQETLEVMVAEGERLSRMVTSMLFLARADNARQALTIERLDARGQLDKLVEVYGASGEEHGVRIVAEGDAVVWADSMLLQRALSNLISNALRYTPSGGEIRLAAREVYDTTEISVTDTGSGIAAEHLPHIFERFYRADPARSSSENTGLGLAVVKSIMELHHGSVSVESRSGAGARFVMSYPVRGEANGCS